MVSGVAKKSNISYHESQNHKTCGFNGGTWVLTANGKNEAQETGFTATRCHTQEWARPFQAGKNKLRFSNWDLQSPRGPSIPHSNVHIVFHCMIFPLRVKYTYSETHTPYVYNCINQTTVCTWDTPPRQAAAATLQGSLLHLQSPRPRTRLPPF